MPAQSPVRLGRAEAFISQQRLSLLYSILFRMLQLTGSIKQRLRQNQEGS